MRRLRVASAWRARSGLTDTGHRTKPTDSRSPIISRSAVPRRSEVRMRLPNSAHTSQPWLVHTLAPDFRVEDVWALPRITDPDDFPRLVQMLASLDVSRAASPAVR